MKNNSSIYYVIHSKLKKIQKKYLLIKKLMKLFKQLLIITIKNLILNPKKIRKWYKMGMHPPAPRPLKQKIIKNYANKFLITFFVETGTFLGEMVYATRKIFD